MRQGGGEEEEEGVSEAGRRGRGRREESSPASASLGKSHLVHETSSPPHTNSGTCGV